MKNLLLLLFLIPLISCTDDGTGEKEVTFLQDRNGIRYEVNSEVGFTGKYVEYFKNGQKLIEKDYKNGKLEGLVTKWHENGQKKSEIKTKNGKVVDGLLIEWHENGQKRSEANWKNGDFDGVVTFWDKEGNVTETETYKDGILVSSNDGLFRNIFENIFSWTF